MNKGIIVFIVLTLVILTNELIAEKEGYVSYPNGIHDFPKENNYYNCINDKVLSSPRLNSYRSYESNKDMYSLNSRILADKKCAPNPVPINFH
jgi:hypothetical protein|tara:strand:+ start:568 stop:846 length:279 start_codon:yes stop_codon:yes gene_type:complete